MSFPGIHLAAIPTTLVHHSLLDAECVMTLETLIAAGVFGWLVIGMVMMGLGIW
jgi:hypothetical protein